MIVKPRHRRKRAHGYFLISALRYISLAGLLLFAAAYTHVLACAIMRVVKCFLSLKE